MGRFLPADHSKGDPNTIGGYMAVHDRPAAFEGSDGASYSVEIVADVSDEKDRPFGAYLLFVRWREGDPVASGHLGNRIPRVRRHRGRSAKRWSERCS